MKLYTNPLDNKKYSNMDLLHRKIKSNKNFSYYESKGITIKQLMFNSRNKYPLDKTNGISIFSGKPTDWNETKGRYERLVDEAEAKLWFKSKSTEQKDKYGTTSRFKDPDFQRRILDQKANGYIFKDGGVINYNSNAELNFLKSCDKYYNMDSGDIQEGLSFPYTYKGKKRTYISDFYIPKLNLIIEIKGGFHRRMDVEILKKKAVISSTNKDFNKKFNFIQIESQPNGKSKHKDVLEIGEFEHILKTNKMI